MSVQIKVLTFLLLSIGLVMIIALGVLLGIYLAAQYNLIK